jgi:hypothetical protein
MRADDTRIVSGLQRGRDSVRIVSKAAYADSIIVLDVQHMPAGQSPSSSLILSDSGTPWAV